MPNQLAWKKVLAFSAAVAAAAAFVLCLSILIGRHASVAAVRSTPLLAKAASSLQNDLESGEIRFHRDNSVLKNTKLFPLESISVERTLCFGDCPTYIMTLRRDGHASLITHDIQDNQIKYYEAEIWPELFARATQLAQSAMSSAKKQNYAGPWTDDYSAIMRVQSEGRSWCVSDYGQVAPVQVWALEELLSQFRNQIQWKISPASPAERSYPSKPMCETPNKSI